MATRIPSDVNGKKKARKVSSSAVRKRDSRDGDDFPIVGIGASAGGLEALEQFFENTPEDPGMAFVIIQHLDPNRIGIMPDLLQRFTGMKVLQISDRLKIKPNHVYVIPPNKSLSVLNGALYLMDPVETHGLRLPVDIFFRSLAEDRNEKSIGIILSGMGSDGSLGVRAIKEVNGLVLIQDPDLAKFDGMPRSASESVDADIIAPADMLPARLIEHLKMSPSLKPDPDKENRSISNLNKIIIMLRDQCGHDFSLYKKNTIFRRIERLKSLHHLTKIQDYVRFLQENPEEVKVLFKELLIGVSSFFRDPLMWEMLRETILPSLIEQLPSGYVIRAWVPGCSTGEEAYSLAITFKEVLEKTDRHKKLSFQIFATDLDPDAIEKARKGLFPRTIESDLSAERLNRFFTMEAEGYRVNNFVREMIVFAPQNVIKDPPFTRLDLLSCRNMMIYMEAALQTNLITLFNNCLNLGGIMVLGTAESIGNLTQGFEEIDGKMKIYRRSAAVLASDLIDFPSSFHHMKNERPERKLRSPRIEEIPNIVDQMILHNYAPASLLVNNLGDILYITGHTGKYIEPVAGKANWNIFAMARQGLREELPVAFRKAMHHYEPVVISHLKIGNMGNRQVVDVTVQRIENPALLKGMLMVIFTEVPEKVENPRESALPGKPRTTGRHKELENELQRLNEELQSTREEMQTSQEELKSTNEELQSTNEELQSTNEELTTSKEEMQSLNEELQTVNIELQSKINDYIRANDDMKNLLNSIEIATLFLDKELNIRRFTDQATEIFKLRNTDIGRPFTDLVTDLRYPEMGQHALQVIKTLSPIETSVTTIDGRWLNVRIMPYRTIDDHIEGSVITFTDITKATHPGSEMQNDNEDHAKGAKRNG